MRIVWLCLLLACARSARAQADPLSPQAAAQLHASAAASTQRQPGAAARTELSNWRLEQRGARRCAGFWLLGWGAASAVAGTTLAIIERDHQAWLAAGITTASFGVINALLAPSLMDLSGARERQIRADQRDPHSDLARIREDELVANLKTGQTFAVNAGLDVFYISAGLLLYALGHVQRPRVGWEEGSGLAMAVQGVPLLAFDLLNWFAANQRAADVRGFVF
jgi:hypothetical protein